MLVHTKLGLVERDELRMVDVEEWHDNARVIATEWFLGEELVRRDVHVSVLRGLESAAQQGVI